MKAISLWQPWLVAFDPPVRPALAKRIENRSAWTESTPALHVARRLVGTRILLHASKGVGTQEDYRHACEHLVRVLGPEVVPSIVERPRGIFGAMARLAWPPATSLARMALVARATLAEVVRTDERGHRWDAEHAAAFDDLLDECRLCGARRIARAAVCPKADPWAFAGVGLVLEGYERLPEPIPYRGGQGWFDGPDLDAARDGQHGTEREAIPK